MIDLGINESLKIRDGNDGAFFTLFPANTQPGIAYYGNYYEVVIEKTPDGRFRASVPAYPRWTVCGPTRDAVKAELEHTIKDDLRRQERLLHEHIRLDPSASGVDQARVMPADVPVWVIVGQLEGAKGDVARVADDWELSADAVEAALIFYRRNRAAIDARRAENAPGGHREWEPDTMPRL